MESIKDFTYKGHEIMVFKDDDGTFIVDIREDDFQGAIAQGFLDFDSAEGAAQEGRNYVDINMSIDKIIELTAKKMLRESPDISAENPNSDLLLDTLEEFEIESKIYTKIEELKSSDPDDITINDIVESWINGNKSWVYDKYIELSISDKTAFLLAMQDANEIECFKSYIIIKEG